MKNQFKARVWAGLLAGLVGVGASTAAMAFDSPFAGTWTMDVARSQVTGDTFTYTKTAMGYAFSNGGPVNFEFALDGKDYPTIPSDSIACTETTPTSMACVHKALGKITSSASRTLSADGNRLNIDIPPFTPTARRPTRRTSMCGFLAARALRGSGRMKAPSLSRAL